MSRCLPERWLLQRHNLSASGAAHHLMRLGAGLAPLPPLDQHHGH
jgi:hypothetical protein